MGDSTMELRSCGKPWRHRNCVRDRNAGRWKAPKRWPWWASSELARWALEGRRPTADQACGRPWRRDVERTLGTMSSSSAFRRFESAVSICALGVMVTTGAWAQEPPAKPDRAPAVVQHKPDLTGRKRVGKASFYAKKFSGRKMANGKPMNPNADNAASKTLPLGTTAQVKNLETGKTAVVTIQDRGPYVDGRIVDLSPSTARKIGITEEDGVAPVEVTPIVVPLPNGGVKAGDAPKSP